MNRADKGNHIGKILIRQVFFKTLRHQRHARGSDRRDLIPGDRIRRSLRPFERDRIGRFNGNDSRYNATIHERHVVVHERRRNLSVGVEDMNEQVLRGSIRDRREVRADIEPLTLGLVARGTDLEEDLAPLSIDPRQAWSPG